MSSVIDICNMALFRIGNGMRIDDLEENSQPARICKQFYESSRDFVLRADCDWGFATAFAQLAEVADNPNPEYPFAYAVPNDCMRVRRIVNPVFPQGVWPAGMHCQMPELPRIQFRIINGSSQRLISTNVSPATLEYTLKVESPEMFDPVFVSALAWYLASQVAGPLAKDAGIASACAGEYRAEVLVAAAAALNESVTQYQHESIFITGRGA
ncbi:hypothetical protein GLGCALEP_02144 [Pseudomonas sp. MM221]|nr:hypothetical protein DBADOPDK_02090 [Pseudomonas sp. MM223]CAI3799101.1 hypothetical protein GLGCALEP_02144 [Pseudomonas sp. MM221]